MAPLADLMNRDNRRKYPRLNFSYSALADLIHRARPRARNTAQIAPNHYGPAAALTVTRADPDHTPSDLVIYWHGTRIAVLSKVMTRTTGTTTAVTLWWNGPSSEAVRRILNQLLRDNDIPGEIHAHPKTRVWHIAYPRTTQIPPIPIRPGLTLHSN